MDGPWNVVQRLWHRLNEVLPTLDREEQSAIGRTMHGRALATPDFYILVLLSATIALLGLRQNSGAVVVGAMLIAPMMNPMMTLGLGLVTGYPHLFWRAAATTLTGIAVAVGVSALLAFLAPSEVPSAEILARAHPNLLDLLVALAAGAAGAYASCRKEVAESLPGVAIAVALVPPLCVAGYGLGTEHLELSLGALLLFATNLASIVLSGIAVFWLLGFRPRDKRDLPDLQRSLRWAALIVVLLMLPLGYASFVQVRQARQKAAVERILAEHLDPSLAEIRDVSIRSSRGDYMVSFTAYVYADDTGEANIAGIQQQIETAVGESVPLRARIIASELGIVPGTNPR